MCVCTPDPSWVKDWDIDGYVCACVQFVARLSITAGMGNGSAVMDCLCVCSHTSKHQDTLSKLSFGVAQDVWRRD